jgi:hypothetical protein
MTRLADCLWNIYFLYYLKYIMHYLNSALKCLIIPFEVSEI